MKKRNLLIAFLILITITLFIVFYIKDNTKNNHNENHELEKHRESIQFSPKQIEEFGIELSQVQIGSLDNELELTGEIKIDEDKLAHIVVYSSGIVVQVNKSLGDFVNKSEVLAVIDSPEISNLQEEHLEATARLEIAEANYEREKQLQKEDLTTQADFLSAKDEYIKSQHDLHITERKLKIFGFNDAEINKLTHGHQNKFDYYRITAPYSGTINKKNISKGEALERNAEVFTIADLSSVWIDFNLYQKDLPFIKSGQKISIHIPNLNGDLIGVIDFISPMIGENTRTAFARVILNNSNNSLKPGTFVTGKIKTSQSEKKLLIKKTAIQELDGQKVVFIKRNDNFTVQEIEIGQGGEDYVEILTGLSQEDIYVSTNSFILKAELEKNEISDSHSH